MTRSCAIERDKIDMTGQKNETYETNGLSIAQMHVQCASRCQFARFAISCLQRVLPSISGKTTLIFAIFVEKGKREALKNIAVRK